MQLGFDAKRLFHNKTGLGNYSRTLLANLATFYPEHDYHLYTSSIPESAIAESYSTASYQTHTSDTFLPSLWRTRGIVKDIRRDSIQVYHGLSNELPYGISRSKAASVVTIHDLIYYRLPHTFRWPDRKIYHAKTKHACQVADHIVAISESTKADILDIFQVDVAKISTVYQACHSTYYEKASTKEVGQIQAKYDLPTDFILHVGTIEPRKNLTQILHALAEMPTDIRPPLVVVGRGKKFLAEAKSLQQALKLPHVHWLHDVESNIELRAIYAAARLLVYTSHYEGFGLPLVEAQLQSTPVIASAVSSLPEAAGPHSTLVSPTDTAELAHRIEQLLGDTKAMKSLGAVSQAFAMKHFSPQKTAAAMMPIYQKLS